MLIILRKLNLEFSPQVKTFDLFKINEFRIIYFGTENANILDF